MKKKKFLLSLTSAAIVVAPIATAISCGVDFGKNYKYYGDIQVITDAGTVSDKSFNQSTFNAVKDRSQLTDKSKTFGFSQPKNTTTALLQKAYISALRNGSRTLVLPGFIHTKGGGGDAVNFAHRMHSKYPTARYICADGWTLNEKAANKDGFYNLGYASAESGFMAAVYGGIYFNSVKHVTSPIKAATFGGNPFGGVTMYMDGYLQGVKYFNDVLASLGTPYKGNSWEKIEMIFSGKNGKASASDFTGSFDSGKGTDIASNFIEKGAQMILPVAGPQTGDVVGVIASTGNKGKVFTFGVDVDQSEVYNPDYFLGSAIKGLYVSNSYALDELSKSGSKLHDKFPVFNMALSNTTKFKAFSELLGKKLKATKRYTDEQIKVMLKPTGFAPSAKMPITISSSDLYERAVRFVKNVKDINDNSKNDNSKNVKDNLNHSLTGTSNAAKAYEKFGGFNEV